MAMRGALHEQVPMVVFAGESIGFGEDEGPIPGDNGEAISETWAVPPSSSIIR